SPQADLSSASSNDVDLSTVFSLVPNSSAVISRKITPSEDPIKRKSLLPPPSKIPHRSGVLPPQSKGTKPAAKHIANRPNKATPTVTTKKPSLQKSTSIAQSLQSAKIAAQKKTVTSVASMIRLSPSHMSSDSSTPKKTPPAAPCTN